MRLRPETQKVLHAIRTNGLEANAAIETSFAYVQVFDPRRGAEASFGFDSDTELQATRKMASDFLSPKQLDEIFGAQVPLSA